MPRPFLTFVLAAAMTACGAGRPAAPAPDDRASVVLVSLDGFRYEYLERGVTPALQALAAEGVRAPLVPSFPTLTFPNHYTMVTGRRPGDHGMVSNTMWDPVFNARFSLSDRDAVGDGRWWEGEPVWVAVERRGGTAMAYFWPGTEAAIGGVRPTSWRPYDGGIPNMARVDTVLGWLARPEGPPDFITLYFDEVDLLGHDVNPDGPDILRALRSVDAALARLRNGIEDLGLAGRVNLIVVSDHGMAARSPDRMVFLDDYVDLDPRRVLYWSPVLLVWPDSARVDSVYRALHGAHPRLTVWRRDEVPARFHYGNHRRVPPIVALLDDGWSATTREFFREHRDAYLGGSHGYDPALPSMRAIFLAAGPAFRAGVESPAFANIHVYELLARLTGIRPAPNAGSPDSTRHLLK